MSGEAFEVEASRAEGEEALQALLSLVRETAGQLEAQEAEKGIFKRLMPLGVAAGLPVATGVVESACGSVVKHRMEGEGQRWSLEGAAAILAVRSLKKSHDNDLRAYWRFHAQQERGRRDARRPHCQPHFHPGVHGNVRLTESTCYLALVF